ncbi:hypothetical protein [Spirillospora sp. CA-294931]|uniref:hypothetical protein n=1 Tax=Spirillospora sp. CA-294931 TaxID=3240042 RepID=UPI003D8D8FF0
MLITIAVGSLATIMLLIMARRWIPRLLVIHAVLRKDGLGWRILLVRRATRFALPVRLTGVGGAAHRLDLSLIERQPSLDLGGVSAGDLAPLKNTKAHLVLHPAFLQLWVRSRLSYHHVAAFAWEDLHDVRFIEHDPERLGLKGGPFRGSVGTLQVFISPQLRLYLLLRIKPDPAILGPGSIRGFSGLSNA